MAMSIRHQCTKKAQVLVWVYTTATDSNVTLRIITNKKLTIYKRVDIDFEMWNTLLEHAITFCSFDINSKAIAETAVANRLCWN